MSPQPDVVLLRSKDHATVALATFLSNCPGPRLFTYPCGALGLGFRLFPTYLCTVNCIPSLISLNVI